MLALICVMNIDTMEPNYHNQQWQPLTSLHHHKILFILILPMLRLILSQHITFSSENFKSHGIQMH